MNKIWSLLLAVIAALAATSSDAAAIRLQNNSTNVSVGDEFLVDVILQDAFAEEFTGDVLLAFGFNLFASPGLSLVSSTVASGWDDDSELLGLDLAGSTFPGIEDDGSGVDILLAQLSFSALEAGNFLIALSGSALDSPNHGLIYLGGETSGLAQTMVTVQPVPLPAAGWLLASALVALFRVRRCR